MCNIILISTEHQEIGKCNPDELYKIIDSINPEVIFEEEVNDNTYHKYYDDENSFKSLEVQTIMKYLQNHDIKHIPVDIEHDQELIFRYLDFSDTFKMNQYYNSVLNEHCRLRNLDGFAYLNSKKCGELFEEMKSTQKKLIEIGITNKEEYLHFYERFHQENHKREYGMLNNIYNYCKEFQFDKAVFLHGYAHRNGLIQKIYEIAPKEDIKINWDFYTDNNYQ